MITSASAPATFTQWWPTSHCRSSTKSCVTAITCSASQLRPAASSERVASFSVFQMDR